jgi:hypothetical protein
MLPTKFQFIWPNGFRKEDLSEINKSKTRMTCGGHVSWLIGTKWAICREDLPRMFPTRIRIHLGKRGQWRRFLTSHSNKLRCIDITYDYCVFVINDYVFFILFVHISVLCVCLNIQNIKWCTLWGVLNAQFQIYLGTLGSS